MGVLASVAAWSIAFVFMTSTLAAQPLPQSVLILDQYAASLPWVGARNSAFRALLNAGRVVPVSIYEENLDFNRFAGPTYKESLNLHFREKYRDKAIGLIVAFGPSALEYAVDMRAGLWPRAAVVFGEIAETAISRSSLPAAVTGTTINITFGEMIIAARALVPELKRIAIVGDLLENLPAYRHFKDEIPTAAQGLDLIDLTGLAMEDLRSRVAVLPGQTAIIYTTINLDRAGVSYVPAEALALVAQVANRPIVISTETFLGRGAVGGFVVTPQAVGQDAARLALRILNGEDASKIAASVSSVNKPIFDWRQLQRWSISESALPPESEVRFRELTAWEQYKWQITVIVAALMLQAGLISWLVYEHRRRSLAEVHSRNAMAELANMNRLATAGQLSASIAHEINQPVTGIVLKASAALRWLAAEKPDMERIRSVLTDIVGAGQRAGDIVNSVRSMFKKDDSAKAAINLNNLVNTVLVLLRVDLQKDGVRVETELDENLPAVIGDAVQLQQVILNLIVNAADAMRDVPPRVLKVQTSWSRSGVVHVSIEDSGTGISESDRERIFAPLFTTKAAGMGMGLSICRAIIENNHGRIWVSPGVNRGSIFHFELPTKSDIASVGAIAA
ncbi:MAG: ABC transporter substrate binding protein [Xanthobacteraceae bacterium]